MKLWILAAILVLFLIYVIMNRDTIILEHLDVVSPLAPTPAVPGSTSAVSVGQQARCAQLKSARDSTDPLQQATYKTAVDQGKIPAYCADILNELSDIPALASKLTSLQQEVDNIKTQSQAGAQQAAAAQAQLQTIN
jgi:hypothetical protein